MGFLAAIPVVNIVANGIKMVGTMVSGWQERKTLTAKAKTEIIKAKVESQITMAEAGKFAEIEIDKSVVDQMADSWKDEYLLIIFTIPAWLCFVPSAQELVTDGFNALANTPEWYQALLAIIVARTFGVSEFIGKITDKFRRN